MYFHEKIIISGTKVFFSTNNYNLDRQGLEVDIIKNFIKCSGAKAQVRCA